MGRRVSLSVGVLLLACCACNGPVRLGRAPETFEELLLRVPEAAQGPIEEAAALLARREAELERAEEEARGVAEQHRARAAEVEAGEGRVAEARAQLAAARERVRDQAQGGEVATNQEGGVGLGAAREELEAADLALRAAVRRLRYYGSLLGLAEDLVLLREAQRVQADASLELAQTRAVAGLEEPAAQNVTLAPAQERVRLLTLHVGPRLTAVRALQRKLEIQRRHFLTSVPEVELPDPAALVTFPEAASAP
jgi:hypothetical protein